jgi:hypothetical protein
MFDNYAHLSAEVRHLTFQKSKNPGTWQDSIRQQQANQNEKYLGRLMKGGRLSDISNAVLLQIAMWKQRMLSSSEDRFQTDQHLANLGTKAPENHPSR